MAERKYMERAIETGKKGTWLHESQSYGWSSDCERWKNYRRRIS